MNEGQQCKSKNKSKNEIHKLKTEQENAIFGEQLRLDYENKLGNQLKSFQLYSNQYFLLSDK